MCTAGNMESEDVPGELIAPPTQMDQAKLIGEREDDVKGIQGLYHSSGLITYSYNYTYCIYLWIPIPPK